MRHTGPASVVVMNTSNRPKIVAYRIAYHDPDRAGFATGSSVECVACRRALKANATVSTASPSATRPSWKDTLSFQSGVLTPKPQAGESNWYGWMLCARKLSISSVLKNCFAPLPAPKSQIRSTAQIPPTSTAIIAVSRAAQVLGGHSVQMIRNGSDTSPSVGSANTSSVAIITTKNMRGNGENSPLPSWWLAVFSSVKRVDVIPAKAHGSKPRNNAVPNAPTT